MTFIITAIAFVAAVGGALVLVLALLAVVAEKHGLRFDDNGLGNEQQRDQTGKKHELD